MSDVLKNILNKGIPTGSIDRSWKKDKETSIDTVFNNYLGKIVLCRLSSESTRCEDVFGIFNNMAYSSTEEVKYFVERFDRTRVFLELNEIITIKEATLEQKRIFKIERRRFI